MSNTGNLTPMDKYFRWFRWIHRTNVCSVGEVFFRWKINNVMTHGKQISVKLRLSDGSEGSIGHRTSEFTIGQLIFPWTFKTSYYKYELRQLLLVCAAIKGTRI